MQKEVVEQKEGTKVKGKARDGGFHHPRFQVLVFLIMEGRN